MKLRSFTRSARSVVYEGRTDASREHYIDIAFVILAMDIAVGVVSYTLALAALWFLAGRPESVERAAVSYAADWLRRPSRA